MSPKAMPDLPAASRCGPLNAEPCFRKPSTMPLPLHPPPVPSIRMTSLPFKAEGLFRSGREGHLSHIGVQGATFRV